MEFEYDGSSLTAILDEPRQIDPHRVDLSAICILRAEDVLRLASATRARLATTRHSTQAGSLSSAFNRFGQYAVERGLTALPTTFDDWQYLLVDWNAWYLSTSSFDASLEQRVIRWDGSVKPWLEGLVEEGILPLGLVISRARFRSEVVNARSPENPELIGQVPVQPTDTNAPINKTIVGPIFWRNDIAYLDEVEMNLRNRNNVLAVAADDYWVRLVNDYRRGKNLLRRVPDAVLKERMARDHWTTPAPVTTGRYRTVNVKVTSPYAPEPEAWVLRVFTHLLASSDDPLCLAWDRLRGHPAFRRHFLNAESQTPIAVLREQTSLRASQWPLLDSRSLYMRFFGLLLPLDMSVACLILIQEHPRLNPESLSEALLLNARGKHFLVTTDAGDRSVFSVDKPRAGTRKYVALTRRAQRVVNHLLRATAPVRALLKRAGSKHWRHLFLGFSPGALNRLGHPRIVSARLWSPRLVSLARFYPEIAEAGMGEGTLDYSKIRATQAVLEWFDTGSVTRASRRLGNSYRVVIEHYIPKPLLRLWNERIIRRFQNTLIVLAAAKEDYLVDVTDFRDHGELQAFVAQILEENEQGSSPIGDALHSVFEDSNSSANGVTKQATEKHALLSVRIDGEALALLYAFRAITNARLSQSEINAPDPQTGLIPKHFVDLASLLSHAAENPNVSDALAETLDLARLRKAHTQAMGKLGALVEAVKNVNVIHAWE